MERGVTLLELLVVLALIGLFAGMSGLAIASLRVPAPNPRADALSRAHAKAVSDGIAVIVAGDSAHGPVLFLPDGRAAGSDVDPLTGELTDASR